MTRPSEQVAVQSWCICSSITIHPPTRGLFSHIFKPKFKILQISTKVTSVHIQLLSIFVTLSRMNEKHKEFWSLKQLAETGITQKYRCACC
jgi:hypothetical protein